MAHPIYLDYNATTPVDKEVLNEIIPMLQSHYGNPSSAYSIGRYTKEAIAKARQQVALAINAKPEEIIFTSCATESNNLAIQGVAVAYQEKGKHIITSAIEHPSVIEVCKHLERNGFEVTYLPVDTNGVVNPEDVASAIRRETILISIMHANNEVGTVQPIGQIATIAKHHQIIFHTDAAQSIGKISTDVDRLGVDLLTIAGHKLYAPKGIGALYIKKGAKIEKIMQGAGQEKGLRPGTENIAFIVGLGKACEIATRDFDKNTNTMLASKDRLLKGLKEKLGNRVMVNVPDAETLPNTLSVAFSGIDSHTLASLIGNDVLLSTGSACHADSVEISSVLKAMNIDTRTATSTIRISTGKYTTLEEADKAIGIIANIVAKF
jgi:cysteine desulfurase